MILRRLALALLALAFAGASVAEGQGFRPGFGPGARAGFQFVGRASLPPAAPIPAVSVAPAVLYHAKVAGSTYSGPALRIARVSDGAQTDIGFDNGRPDLAAARAFAGTANLVPGVLTAVTSYDTTGGANNLTWSSGTAAVPVISARDTYGPQNPDRLDLGVGSQKYPFQGISTVQRQGTIPTTLSLNAQSLSIFTVLTSAVSQQRNAFITAGAASGAGRVTVYQEGSTGTLGLGSLGTTGGTASTDTKAPFSMLLRNSPEVVSVISGASGKLIQVEDRSFQGSNVEDSRTITGGGVGLTAGGNTYFLNADLHVLAIYPTALSSADAAQVRAVLSSNFDTARRPIGVFVVGSSTPEGAGSTFNRSYVRLMAGMLDRRVDVWNGALFGQMLSDSQGNAATRVWPALAGYSLPILWIDGGANDFLGNSTDTQVYNIAKNYSAAFKAQFPNGKVVITTATGKSTATTAQDNYRISYNNLVLNNKAELKWDAVFNRAGIPQAQVLTDTNWFRQETDGSFIHANDNLHFLYAQGAAQVLQGVLP